MRLTVFVLFLIFFSALNSIAQVAITNCNGDWNNEQSWKDFKIPQEGDSIFIKHYIRFTDTLELEQNFTYIEEIGEICGNYPLIQNEGSRIENYGRIGALTITVYDSLFNRGYIQSTSILIKRFFSNTDGGSTLVTDHLNCFERPVCTPEIVRVSEDSIKCNILADGYKWYFNDEVIESLTTRTIFPENYGEYTVRTIDEFGSLSALSNVYLHQQASIAELDNVKLNIFPNPSIGVFTIESQKNIEYEIRDVLGKTVFSSSTDEHPKLNLSRHGTGVYFFIDKQSNSVRRLVVK